MALLNISNGTRDARRTSESDAETRVRGEGGPLTVYIRSALPGTLTSSLTFARRKLSRHSRCPSNERMTRKRAEQNRHDVVATTEMTRRRTPDSVTNPLAMIGRCKHYGRYATRSPPLRARKSRQIRQPPLRPLRRPLRRSVEVVRLVSSSLLRFLEGRSLLFNSKPLIRIRHAAIRAALALIRAENTSRRASRFDGTRRVLMHGERNRGSIARIHRWFRADRSFRHSRHTRSRAKCASRRVKNREYGGTDRQRHRSKTLRFARLRASGARRQREGPRGSRSETGPSHWLSVRY